MNNKLIIILCLCLMASYGWAQDYIIKDTSYTTLPNNIALKTYYANLEDAEGDCSNEGKHLRIRGLQDGGYAEFTTPNAGSVSIGLKGKSTGADRIVNIFRDNVLIESFSGLDANNCATFYEEINKNEPVTYRIEGGDAESTKPIIVTSIKVSKYGSETSNEYISISKAVDIYPTITSDQVFIRVNSTTNFIKAQVFDFTGKQVLSQSAISTQEMTIDMSTVSQGYYILQVTYQGGVERQKIVRK